jgi:PhzF family phenazine biosynthesis protein
VTGQDRGGTRRMLLVDVFAERPFFGNPVAVVCAAEGLTTAAMQRITRWLNLSEATFLLPPTQAEADYRVRIFTPARELPFAGHPTLGSCHAWLAAGGRPRDPAVVVQECRAGLVRIRRDGVQSAFAAPPLVRTGPVAERDLAAALAALRIDRSTVVAAEWADNGPGWLVLLLASAQAVLEVEPVGQAPEALDIGIVGPCPPGHDAAFELRAFFTDQRRHLREDPVTGSLNAAAAQWLIGAGRAVAPYVASQGARLGCAGRIHISQDSDATIWVGGRTTTVLDGEGSWPMDSTTDA